MGIVVEVSEGKEGEQGGGQANNFSSLNHDGLCLEDEACRGRYWVCVYSVPKCRSVGGDAKFDI